MQYLRMLTNAILGGALAGAYVTLLVLQLNPGIQLDSLAVSRLLLTWWAFYGFHAAVFFYVLIVIRQLIAVEVRSPGWMSLRLLAEFGTFGVSLATLATWLNLRGFRSVLGPDVATRMTSGATVLSACAALCLALALIQVTLGRGRRLVAILFAVVLVASLAFPLALRGVGTPPPGEKSAGPVGGIAPVPSTARVSMILL